MILHFQPVFRSFREDVLLSVRSFERVRSVKKTMVEQLSSDTLMKLTQTTLKKTKTAAAAVRP